MSLGNYIDLSADIRKGNLRINGLSIQLKKHGGGVGPLPSLSQPCLQLRLPWWSFLGQVVYVVSLFHVPHSILPNE